MKWTTEYRLKCDGPACQSVIGPAPDQDACAEMARQGDWLLSSGAAYCPYCAFYIRRGISTETMKGLADTSMAFQILLSLAKLAPPDISLPGVTPACSSCPRPYQVPLPSKCEHCGHGRIHWRCPECSLRLCRAHHECPVCEVERNK